MSSSAKPTKKRKAVAIAANGSKKAENQITGDDYDALSLQDIQTRIGQLCCRVPRVPEEGLDEKNNEAVRDWATQLQAVIEEFNLLLCCVSAATYKWGSERSGAADQNLSVLSAELSNAQDQISSSVTPRLTNLLAPVVDLVIDKTITTKNDKGEEIKQNIFTRKQVDPDFLRLCATILCRNAKLLRQVVLANFHKIHKCIGDYLQAHKKDTQHDSRGFAY